MKVLWVLDHEDDLYADFMRFFPQLGLDPVAALDGPKYFALARRVFAYGGVMAVRARQWQEENESQSPTPTRSLFREDKKQYDEKGRQVVSLAAFRAMSPGVIHKHEPKKKVTK